MLEAPGELVFAEDFGQAGYQLIELEAEVLAALQDEADRFVIVKGPKKAQVKVGGTEVGCATLCTKSSTFMMRKAESSNTHLLVLPAAGEEDQDMEEEENEYRQKVVGEVNFKYELLRIAPAVGRLKQILLSKPLDENNVSLSFKELERSEVTQRNIGFSFKDLLRRVQASEEELHSALIDLGAYAPRGTDVWMLVEPKLEIEILNSLLGIIIEFGLNANKFSGAIASGGLIPKYGEVCLDAVLHAFSEKSDEDEDNDKRKLKFEKVARFKAREILENESPVNKEDFLREWSISMPKEVPTNPAFLRGLAIEIGGVLHYFPAERLSQHAADSFAALFNFRSHWRLHEIDPYIQHLLGPTTKKTDLFRKFTRSVRLSLHSEERVLTAR